MWAKLVTSVVMNILAKIGEYIVTWVERWVRRVRRDRKIDEAFEKPNGQDVANDLDRIVGK